MTERDTFKPRARLLQQLGDQLIGTPRLGPSYKTMLLSWQGRRSASIIGR
jgi:hypothetical protein